MPGSFVPSSVAGLPKGGYFLGRQIWEAVPFLHGWLPQVMLGPEDLRQARCTHFFRGFPPESASQGKLCPLFLV